MTTGMSMVKGTVIPMDDGALARLMTWLSPSYPVGAYTYSHGIEWAVETGEVCDRASLVDWIATVVARGGGRNDAIMFVHAHRAVANGDTAALAGVCELAAAFSASAERYLETTAQGGAFAEVTRAAWHSPGLDLLARAWNGPLAYPVAVAAAAAGHGIDVAPALTAYLHGFAANLVSAGVRLVPLGQTDGQRAIAALLPATERTRDEALDATLDDLGGSALRSDLSAMHHETQTTRLFRS